MTTIIILNAVLATLAVAAVLALVRLAHRLPAAAPHDDSAWGRGGNPWVPSDPLPLAQIATHETARDIPRAA